MLLLGVVDTRHAHSGVGLPVTRRNNLRLAQPSKPI